MLIALCGRRRSGKDTVATHLVQAHGFRHHKISQPLKDAMACLFGFDAADMETDRKELVHPAWNVSPRTLMQYIGTDVFRVDIQTVIPGIGDTFWVKRFSESVRRSTGDGAPIVVSDLRFMNEYDYLKKEWGDNFRVLRIDRSGAHAEDTHVSELEYQRIPYDALINNAGSIDSLCEQAAAAAFSRS